MTRPDRAAGIRIAIAGPADVARVADVLDEAARWLRLHGIRQWPAAFPRDWVASRVRDVDVYLAWRDGEAVGTFSLQAVDAELWGERPDDALYLHSLAVRRGYSGLGRQLLSWSEGTAGAAGRRYLRLDCRADNPALCGYYERAGYLRRGDAAAGWYRAALYEKEVSVRPTPSLPRRWGGAPGRDVHRPAGDVQGRLGERLRQRGMGVDDV